MNSAADYVKLSCYKTHIYTGLFYIQAGVFTLRGPMKCSTVFISGYPSCIIVEICGDIALI